MKTGEGETKPVWELIPVSRECSKYFPNPRIPPPEAKLDFTKGVQVWVPSAPPGGTCHGTLARATQDKPSAAQGPEDPENLRCSLLLLRDDSVGMVTRMEGPFQTRAPGIRCSRVSVVERNRSRPPSEIPRQVTGPGSPAERAPRHPEG